MFFRFLIVVCPCWWDCKFLKFEWVLDWEGGFLRKKKFFVVVVFKQDSCSVAIISSSKTRSLYTLRLRIAFLLSCVSGCIPETICLWVLAYNCSLLLGRGLTFLSPACCQVAFEWAGGVCQEKPSGWLVSVVCVPHCLVWILSHGKFCSFPQEKPAVSESCHSVWWWISNCVESLTELCHGSRCPLSWSL